MKLLIYLFLSWFLLSVAQVKGQNPEEADTAIDQSLERKFQDLIDKSETYQDYKVIGRDRLASFWSEVTDTLVQNGKDRVDLEENLRAVNKNISQVEVQLKESQDELEMVKFEKDRISFLGLELIKNQYSYLVWGIILILAILVVVANVRYITTSRTTKRVKREGHELQSEFEEFKKKTLEKETKLRRELQTEINTVEELKQKVTLHKS